MMANISVLTALQGPALSNSFSTSALGKESIALEADFEIMTDFGTLPTLAISAGELVSTPNLNGTNGLDFDPSGRYMCATLRNATEISIVDVETRTVRNTEAHKGAVLGGKFTPDGKFLATWSPGFQNSS